VEITLAKEITSAIKQPKKENSQSHHAGLAGGVNYVGVLRAELKERIK
jgi:hypothetical protein